MRILLDYRPALRERTGVGEYVHELARALAATSPAGDSLMLFTSSWRDRPAPGLTAELVGARITDWRVPVSILTWAWHHLGWPPADALAGAADVAHSPTPLLLPARRAARVVTVHDLDFLDHPERATGEMRRDYPRLARDHAHRADRVIAVSAYTARQVTARLGVPPAKISVCSAGPPAWTAAVAAERAARQAPGGCVLFVGTLEPRKNVGGLLDAYEALVARRPDAPPLCLAGRAGAAAMPWLERVGQPPFNGRVRVTGYVLPDQRPALYRDARMLVLPSFEEGFGLPVLEAMACGVPVVVSDRGALPEVAGAAARPVDPDDHEALAAAMAALLDDDAAADASRRGAAEAARYSWTTAAAAAREAYRLALDAREARS
ncbi:MAG: glycosyltransferase family 4 protein [Vicinamibacterales bacterium]